jgi:transposase
MKSKDLHNIVLSKYQNGDAPTKICRDLNGGISLATVKRWCQMIRRTGSIELPGTHGGPRIVRTKENIQKVKSRVRRKKGVSARKLSVELGISATSVRRILKIDLGLKPYKKVIEPSLSDDQKIKRKKFANWVRNNFRKEETMRILFSHEKFFDIDGVYNSQNDRVWVVDRADADEKGGIQQRRKFPQKVMVWLVACSKGITPLVILDEGTVDHNCYIKKVLPVALKYGNKVFGDDWIFQQDGAKPHQHHLTQKWCQENFPSFIDKDHWPPNSPDLNPLDYSIWDEFANVIDWNKVKSKATLIQQLKSSVKKIRESVVVESCTSWTNRLYRMSQNDGNYLH